MMARFAYAVAVGLVGAIIVNLSIIFLLPALSEQSAWAIIQDATELDTPIPIENLPTISTLENTDPMMRSIVCRFDLTSGLFSVRANGTSAYWSSSVHGADNTVLFSANDRIAPDNTLDLVLANPEQQRTIRQQPPEAFERSIVIPLEADQGFVVVRAFQPDESWSPVNDAFFNSLQCGPLSG